LRRSTSAKAPPVAAIIRKNRRHLNDLTAFICPIVVIVQSLRENREGTIESTEGWVGSWSRLAEALVPAGESCLHSSRRAAAYCIGKNGGNL
jgi:hypothetical protein